MSEDSLGGSRGAAAAARSANYGVVSGSAAVVPGNAAVGAGQAILMALSIAATMRACNIASGGIAFAARRVGSAGRAAQKTRIALR
jgi:hypothetical protein